MFVVTDCLIEKLTPKMAISLSVTPKNLRYQALKSRVASQGIEQRLDFEVDDVGINRFATRSLDLLKRLFIFAQAEVNKGEADGSDVTIGTDSPEFVKKIPGFVGLASLRISLRKHRQGCRIIR